MKKIMNIKKYLLEMKDGEKILEAFNDHLNNNKTGSIKINDYVYVNFISYKTKDSFDHIFECHQQYIDLHVMLKGNEKIYIAKKNNTLLIKDYNQKDDYELLKTDEFDFVEYCEMEGIEISTNEPHMAGFQSNSECNVYKAVVKIKINN